MSGTICSSSVIGPVHQVMVPPATAPASSSIRGCSAASNTAGASAPGIDSRDRAVRVSPWKSTWPESSSGTSADRYSRMWRAGRS